MPETPTAEDTRDLLKAGLTPPARGLHTWMGMSIGLATVLWAIAIVGIFRANGGDMPGLVAGALVIAAGTASVIACILAVALASWRANTAEHKQIHEDIGRIAAQQEQISERLSAIDPWTIYCKIAEDLLGIKADPRAMP